MTVMHVMGDFVRALFADCPVARLAVANGEITKHVRHGAAVCAMVAKVAANEPAAAFFQQVAVARANHLLEVIVVRARRFHAAMASASVSCHPVEAPHPPNGS